jgi:hypothetical protein
VNKSDENVSTKIPGDASHKSDESDHGANKSALKDIPGNTSHKSDENKTDENASNESGEEEIVTFDMQMQSKGENIKSIAVSQESSEYAPDKGGEHASEKDDENVPDKSIDDAPDKRDEDGLDESTGNGVNKSDENKIPGDASHKSDESDHGVNMSAETATGNKYENGGGKKDKDAEGMSDEKTIIVSIISP